MRYELRDYQQKTAADAASWLTSASPGQRKLYASPTGTGKSVMELAVQASVSDSESDTWIVTPRIEIVAGLLEKLDYSVAELSEQKLVDLAWDLKITTPIRLRNAMLEGRMPSPPTRLIIDECHHHNADTYGQIDLLAGTCPAVGFTATPYRGSPRSTAAFREAWGPPTWSLTYPEAVAQGHLSMPRCEIIPLLDDDELTVTNGEFVTKAVAKATQSRLQEVANLSVHWSGNNRWDRPTMFACPNTETAVMLCDLLNAAGYPATTVTQATSSTNRKAAFHACVTCQSALVQINVVSEGVDLPIRRLVDLSPMLSPVRWLQQFGRITRPTDNPPHYVCTNRNLLRHAYLLDGCLPPAVVAEAAAAFGGLGKRAAARVIGLESLGRLKGVELPLRDGQTALAYCVSAVQGTQVREYAVIVHPAKADPIWATRTRVRATESTPATYGKWKACPAPEGLVGYSSVPPSPLSEKQAAWWKRSAGLYGLDPTATVTRKNFVALPVLSDLRTVKL